jgi:hypothetical protein
MMKVLATDELSSELGVDLVVEVELIVLCQLGSEMPIVIGLRSG